MGFQNFWHTRPAGKDVDIVAFGFGGGFGFVDFAVLGAMRAHIRRKSSIEEGFASAVHVFAAAMWQKQGAFFGLQKVTPLRQIRSLNINKVLYEN
jgi:hypothetical protein